MDESDRLWIVEVIIGPGKPVPPQKPAQAPVDRTPRDVSWYRRGEECPH